MAASSKIQCRKSDLFHVILQWRKQPWPTGILQHVKHFYFYLQFFVKSPEWMELLTFEITIYTPQIIYAPSVWFTHLYFIYTCHNKMRSIFTYFLFLFLFVSKVCDRTEHPKRDYCLPLKLVLHTYFWRPNPLWCGVMSTDRKKQEILRDYKQDVFYASLFVINSIVT
jgi:hypothetical protein